MERKGLYSLMLLQKRIALLTGIIMIISLFLAACGQKADVTEPSNGIVQQADSTAKLTVYTSFYPLYDFTQKIAGDRADVVSLVPPGAEPHDFEPTAKDLMELSEADVFIYNGSGFEVWIEKVLNAIDTSNMIVVNSSEHVLLLTNEKTGHDSEAHEDEVHHDEAYGDGIHDPHIWLDPLSAKDIAHAIKDVLIQADSEGRTTYENNFQELAADLDQLHAEYQEAVAESDHKEIVVSHAAFGYLANRYGLTQIAISGLSPSDEPSQNDLQEIITFTKEHDVKYILFETLVSGKVAESIRKQIGAEALPLNPLEGLTKEELAGGKDYFSVMRDNLESLKKALGVTKP